MSDRTLVPTSTPGIYKRGDRYVVRYRDPHGRGRKRFARTLAEARALRATLTADVERGEYRALSAVTFAEYAPAWIAGYQGRTSRGIRPETIADYRADLGLDRDGKPNGGGAVAYFGRRRLAAITPADVKGYAAHVAARGLAPNTVRLALAPVRALLATAFEEGLIRSNPAAGVRIAQRVADDADSERAKAMTEEEVGRLLAAVRCPACVRASRPACGECDRWRLFFRFLTATGLRIGEAVALRWGDVDFGNRRVKVRRRLYRGALAPPKSRFGRRDVPLPRGLSQELWRLRGALPDEAPVFASATGGLLDPSNVFARVLTPARKAAGLDWVGFHTFRHTCATALFRAGRNAKQAQVWLGHHSPAFTLQVYTHLLPDDLGDAPEAFDRLGGDQVEVVEPNRVAELVEQAATP